MFYNFIMIGIVFGFLVNVSGFLIFLIFVDVLDFMICVVLFVVFFGMGGVLFCYKLEGDLCMILFFCGLFLMV